MEGSEEERSTGIRRRGEGRGGNEKMDDEEERRTGYCDGSLVRAKVFSVGWSVPERTARQRAANENKNKECKMDGAGGNSSVGCESSAKEWEE
jgi:hypothetical protein